MSLTTVCRVCKDDMVEVEQKYEHIVYAISIFHCPSCGFLYNGMQTVIPKWSEDRIREDVLAKDKEDREDDPAGQHGTNL